MRLVTQLYPQAETVSGLCSTVVVHSATETIASAQLGHHEWPVDTVVATLGLQDLY